MLGSRNVLGSRNRARVSAQGWGGEDPEVRVPGRRIWVSGRGTEARFPCQAHHHLGSGKFSPVLTLEGCRTLWSPLLAE